MIKGSDLDFDYVDSLYYKCHKILNHGGSHIDSPDWIKKASINLINNNNNNICLNAIIPSGKVNTFLL